MLLSTKDGRSVMPMLLSPFLKEKNLFNLLRNMLVNTCEP